MYVHRMPSTQTENEAKQKQILLISCKDKFLKDEHFHAKHQKSECLEISQHWYDAGKNVECLQQWKSTIMVLKNVSCQYRIYTFLKDI